VQIPVKRGIASVAFDEGRNGGDVHDRIGLIELVDYPD
jgi:hypothetical protein